MKHSASPTFRVKRLSQAVSLALASLVSGSALGQQAAAPASAPVEAPVKTNDEVTTVMVVGARASQQSAIARKKNAATAQDSIIAEDVGAFPDRNVADAISRVAGVAVERGDFGEGISVSIRGNGPELTRVELDGQAVQSAGGSNQMGGFTAGSDGGRGVEMRQLPSDLIKSVDVVKGSTADMTEGSLGGGVIIKTRTGLDFKKDYFSFRVAGTANSINREVNPDLNLVATKKLMGDRLGLMINLSKSRADNEAHSINMGGQSSVVGPNHFADFDQSPEKTFSFQPQTVLDIPEANNPLLASPLTGGGFFNSASARDIVTKSAAAATKQDCYAAFPLLSAAQTGAVVAANRNAAVNQRQNELLSCLNQWNDWTPSASRYTTTRQEDRRVSADLRLDFKVNDNLTVYGKYNASEGKVSHFLQTMSLGSFSQGVATTVNPLNGYSGPTYTQTMAPQPNGAAGVRTAIPAANMTVYPDLVYNANTGPLIGNVVNVVPGSVTVDANHRVTSAKLSNAFYGLEGTVWDVATDSRYVQGGGTYRNGPLTAEFLLGDSRSKFHRVERRLNLGFSVPGGTEVAVTPTGLWTQRVADGVQFDPTNPSNYYALQAQPASAAVAASVNGPAVPAYTAAQRPLVSTPQQIQLQTPRYNETSEQTAKLDLRYALSSDRVPFISTIKTGFNLRKTDLKAWQAGGTTISEPVGTFGTPGYVPGVYVPNLDLRTTVQACENTPGSSAPGGQACAYGYTPSTVPGRSLQGAIVVTEQQYRDALTQALSLAPWSTFYNSVKDRPATLVDGWTGIDVEKFYKAVNVQNYNLDCIVKCKGSDGNIYEQPYNAVTERVNAGYLMTEFEFDRIPYTSWEFPFGMVIDGNFGYRVVNTKVQGTGVLTFQSIKKTAAYNPLDRDNAAGISTVTYRKKTAIENSSTDYMPSLNLNLWAVPDTVVVRYNQAKTIARPGAGRLVPSGTCIYDERLVGELDSEGEPVDQGCRGTMGNPGVRPQTNRNKNLSVEWYVNKDTMLAASAYKQTGIIGSPSLAQLVQDVRLFEGSELIDVQTGKPLSEVAFDYNHWTNQLPSTRTGFELSSKTAFTFLPSVLRYTGLDLNYTKNKSKLTTGVAIRDLLTGEVMPVSGEPKHSYNWSLWYDDGALSARFAVQVVAEIFTAVSGSNRNGVNNYPAQGTANWVLPYNPGPSNWRRGTRYADAKIAYRFKNNIELFAEARNIGRIHTGNTTGPDSRFASGAPTIYTDSYGGARVMVGVNFKNQ